ncbi:phospholipase A and acyltransferase 4-like [Dromiciops gliroides]|uniref:phospholipase A and acyltransferase 4-like n=1 Tax=Dromiciops gliroides TaxID=33562 RepID=UPI001CC786A7|nr:phospholipase A and acyltransferase 4-like [Dromiciops gliroides]
MPVPKPGDMIRFPSKVIGWHHWGIYVGDNTVVHLVPKGRSALEATTAKVKKRPLGKEYSISNNCDIIFEPRPPEVIIKNALKMVDEILPYCFFTENCRRFVTDLRYGKFMKNRRLQDPMKLIGIVGGLLLFGLILFP